jgi:hypothetical protein
MCERANRSPSSTSRIASVTTRIAGFAILLLIVVACEEPVRQDPARQSAVPESTESIQNAAIDQNSRLIYVPAYAYAVDSGSRIALSTTLTVHNTTLESIRIEAVEYFDAEGRFVESLLSEARDLGALGTLEFSYVAGNVQGGTGANFIVAWSGPKALQAPLTEALMVGSQGAGRLTFISRGVDVQNPLANEKPGKFKLN